MSHYGDVVCGWNVSSRKAKTVNRACAMPWLLMAWRRKKLGNIIKVIAQVCPEYSNLKNQKG